jgi:hypothetical protein
MRVSGVTEGSFGETGRMPHGETPEAVAPRAESRALTVIAPEAPRELPSVYRQAPFLAQLIASRDQHAQARSRRRADPHEAIAAYRAGAGLTTRQ